MHGGEPALPADFTGLRYANPQAPKGGRLVQGILGTFDSLNPLIVKGLALSAHPRLHDRGADGARLDEPFTLYGLMAESVETDDERSYVTFNLNPHARFSDGKL